MNKALFWALLIAAFFQVPFASGQAMKSWHVEIVVDEKGFAGLEMLFVADSSSGENIEMADIGCEGIRAYDLGGTVNYEANGGKIFFSPRSKEANYSFSMKCASSNFTSKGKDWRFSIALPFEKEKGTIKIILPPGAYLMKSEPEAMIYAEDSVISLGFKDANIASVTYSFTNAAAEKGGGQDYFLIGAIIAILVLALISFFAFYYRNKRWKSGKNKEGKEFMKYLNENEKKIVSALEKGRLTQRKLQMACGLPKSTLSRTLKKMENRGIVKTVSAGNTKYVELLDN